MRPCMRHVGFHHQYTKPGSTRGLVVQTSNRPPRQRLSRAIQDGDLLGGQGLVESSCAAYV